MDVPINETLVTALSVFNIAFHCEVNVRMVKDLPGYGKLNHLAFFNTEIRASVRAA